MDIYIKLEENALFERQMESYANQLDVLMQSEEKNKCSASWYETPFKWITYYGEKKRK